MKERIKQEEEYRKSLYEKLHSGIQYDSAMYRVQSVVIYLIKIIIIFYLDK